MNALVKFLFKGDAGGFFKKSSPVLYLSIIFFIWQHDWIAYTEMSHFLFSPPGLLSKISLPFPSLANVRALQIIGTISAAILLLPLGFKEIASWLVFISLFLLDFFSNGFGFVNVQIHLVWFSLIYAMVFLLSTHNWFINYAFRFIELIIVMAYLQSFIAKTLASGLNWGLDGTVLQIGILRQGIPYGLFIANNVFLSKLISIVTLLFEFSFISYFFLPRKMKKFLLSLGIVFHISTFIMLDIGFFHLWVMSFCIIFFAYKGKRSTNHIF